MPSVPDRYCVRGEQCAHYAELGEPAKLSRYNDDDTCERCRGVESDNPAEEGSSQPRKSTSPPHTFEEEYRTRRARREDVRVLDTSLLRQLQNLKRDWVLQLFTKDGPFWEEIKRVRSRWNVTPAKQLPPQPSFGNLLLPEDAPESPNDALSPGADEFFEYLDRWSDDIWSAIDEMLPRKYWNFEWLFAVWVKFFEVCVLYDPPETDLLEFAAYRDPRPLDAQLVEWDEDSDFGTRPQLPHLVSPVKAIYYDSFQREDAANKYWIGLIRELGEQHLKPLGLDIYALLDDTRKNTPWLGQEYEERKRNAQLPNHLFIEVDEDTTEEDVRKAFRAITATQKNRPKTGRPGRDQLTCVECAVLHDRHDWDYSSLAERYGWDDPTLASKYIKYGRATLGA